MRPVQIFISYRRDDSAGYARAVYDELARHWGADRVFIDVDDIGAGQAFLDVIRQAVGSSEVLLVLIGPRWQGERAGQPSRLHDDDDFVRLEVAAALEHGMRVIPVLLDGAAMPTETQLPELLRPLAGRHALELRHTRYAADLQRLVDALRELLGDPAADPAPAPPAPPRAGHGRRRLLGWVGIAGLGAAAAAGFVAWTLRPPRRPPVNGRWRAEVEYDWPNAHFVEHFDFRGEGGELHGSAAFLRVPRGLLEGRVDAHGLHFVTRTTTVSGSAERETVHRYRGRLVGDELHFVMQTEGGFGTHVPVEFVARRIDGTASQPAR